LLVLRRGGPRLELLVLLRFAHGVPLRISA
jgi:hypothetical protein